MKLFEIEMGLVGRYFMSLEKIVFFSFEFRWIGMDSFWVTNLKGFYMYHFRLIERDNKLNNSWSVFL